ncbi:NADH-quinone oxidoreductase subunit I [Chryseolinea sp. T2]|uniref:NuoI/complex I 23 kDa subunit family protein n=1 Tax=Chryseolinea sp. T2 TaxID=3129255 RepID=UPI00307838C1
MIRSTNTYFSNISLVIRSLVAGLRITIKHLFKARRTQPIVAINSANYFDKRSGIATIQYPYEMQPVPDNGRYRLHNEIDDCIVCDKCAKICPVDCIEIEPVRAIEEIGKTSDGTSKRIYAAKFDIDMGKCCFCGLCTTVCPTECLTMTKVYDFSVTDIHEHNFAFGEMSEAEISEKKRILEEYQKAKAAPTQKEVPAVKEAPAAKEADDVKGGPAVSGSTEGPVSDTPKAGEAPRPAKPVFKPRIKPPSPPSTSS